jgi:general secretion pathway protein G
MPGVGRAVMVIVGLDCNIAASNLAGHGTKRTVGGGTCSSGGRIKKQAGMTLLELIIACAILLVLSSAALPIARFSVQRHKEAELRNDRETMRDAIDAYRDAADKQQIHTQPGGSNYPPDLDTLVKGIPLAASGDKRIRFLRKVPVDPMTGRADWGLRGVEDDADSLTWGGKDVFDVYSTSTGTAMNGTKYSDW